MSNAQHAPETADRQPLTVWCGSTQYGAPVLQALAGTYAADIRQTLPRPDDIAGDTGADLLLLYLTPARAVAQALAQGTPPAKALKDWQAQTRAILQLSRRNRRRVQVFELDRVLRHPAAFQAGLGLPEHEFPAAPETEPGGGDPFLLLLAQRLLLGDAPSRALIAELGAASASLPDNAPAETDDPETLLLAYQDMQAQTATQTAVQTARLSELEDDLSQAQSGLEAARNAADLLQAQTRFMQEEAETLAQRLMELEDEARHNREQVQHQTARADTLAQRTAEKEHSLAAAGQMMRDLEAQSARLTADLAVRENRIARLQGRLDHVLGSRSYRLTAPLRRLRALFTGGRQA